MNNYRGPYKGEVSDRLDGFIRQYTRVDVTMYSGSFGSFRRIYDGPAWAVWLLRWGTDPNYANFTIRDANA